MSWFDSIFSGIEDLFSNVSWDDVGKAANVAGSLAGAANSLGLVGGDKTPERPQFTMPTFQPPQGPQIPNYDAWTPGEKRTEKLPTMLGGLVEPSGDNVESLFLAGKVDPTNRALLDLLNPKLEAHRASGYADPRIRNQIAKHTAIPEGADPYNAWRKYLADQGIN